MSERRDPTHRRHHRAHQGLALLWLLAVPHLSTLAQEPPCSGAETLAVNTILRRSPELPPGVQDLVRVVVPEAGMLELYVSSSVLETPPRLTFLGAGCSTATGEGESWNGVDETPREIRIRIRAAGDFFVAVSSEDPAVALAPYSLHAVFAPEPTVPDEVVWFTPSADCHAGTPAFSASAFSGGRFVILHRSPSSKDVDPWDDDEVSGLTAGEPGVLMIETPDVLDARLYDGIDCSVDARLAEGLLDGTGSFVAAAVHAGEKRLVLNPRSTFETPYEVHVKHFALCGAAADDHGDRPLCSTGLPWAGEMGGVIEDALDEDHFSAFLDMQDEVTLELWGAGVLGVLYDGNGQRLATWSGGLTRTLGAGRFYVRVAAAGGQGGTYTVRITATP